LKKLLQNDRIQSERQRWLAETHWFQTERLRYYVREAGVEERGDLIK